MEVTILCKVCNRSAPADQFKLHYKWRQVVCPRCQSGKEPVKQEVKVEPPKPAGWDQDDEYLEKASRQRKVETQAQFSKIAGSNLVKCKCFSCKYDFKYDPVRKTPYSCPYCNADIPKLKTFNL
ncbi:MAG: hypothetical protein Q8R37_00585 [Nanoarchaeota archaeon]|nr:hypothetical protein [Nanoarchaeota archaeon]